jgi:zinc protease
LGGLLSQSPNGRLYQALVESKLASSVFGRVDNAHDPGLFTASAQVEADKLEAARDAMLKTLEEMSSVPFTEAEVERAKGRSKRNAESLASDASGMAQALSSASALGDWRCCSFSATGSARSRRPT